VYWNGERSIVDLPIHCQVAAFLSPGSKTGLLEGSDQLLRCYRWQVFRHGARHLHESAENKRYFFIRDRLTMGLKVLQVELNRFFGILCRLFYGGAIRYTARKKGQRYRVAPFLFRNQVDLVRQYFLHKVILYTNWVPVKLAGSAISVRVEVRAQLTLGDVSERLFINCYRCAFVQVTMSRNGEHLLGTVRQNSSQHNVAPTLRYRLESEGNKHADAEFSFQLFQPS
jgi:hypothetical protein